MVVDEVLAGEAVEVVEETRAYVVGVLGRMVLLRTREPMTTQAMEALFRTTTEGLALHGPRILYVVMPGAQQPRIDEAAAAVVASLWPKIQAQSSAGVVWIRSRSFNGVVQRNLLAELLANLRHRSLLGVTDSAAETIKYFVANVADFEVDVTLWTEALEAFGRRYD